MKCPDRQDVVWENIEQYDKIDFSLSFERDKVIFER